MSSASLIIDLSGTSINIEGRMFAHVNGKPVFIFDTLIR